MLLESQDIGHDLAGVRVVGQAVDHRNGGVFRQLDKTLMGCRADHDRVYIARQHLCRIGNGLGTAELHFRTREHDRLAAKLAHADIKGNAGTGRRLVEDHRQRLALERLFTLAGFQAFLARPRIVEHEPQVLRINGRKINEMAQTAGHARLPGFLKHRLFQSPSPQRQRRECVSLPRGSHPR